MLVNIKVVRKINYRTEKDNSLDRYSSKNNYPNFLMTVMGAIFLSDIINLMKKTAQQVQDSIFRRMSAEKKIKLISSFWHFAKTVSGTSKIYHNIDGIREHIKKSH